MARQSFPRSYRPDGVTLGQMIRGLRFGFCMCHCGWLRIHAGGPPHKIEVLPIGTTKFPSSNGAHVCWWPDGAGKPGINPRLEIKPLFGVLRVKLPVTFYVDDNGEMVR